MIQCGGLHRGPNNNRRDDLYNFIIVNSSEFFVGLILSLPECDTLWQGPWEGSTLLIHPTKDDGY